MPTAQEILDQHGIDIHKPEKEDCAECRRYAEQKSTFHPRHEPSSYCESGKHPHCTCPICWG